MGEKVYEFNIKKEKRLKYTCHHCGKKGSYYKTQIIEQAFTGRRFCSYKCWGDHKASKGLQ